METLLYDNWWNIFRFCCTGTILKSQRISREFKALVLKYLAEKPRCYTSNKHLANEQIINAPVMFHIIDITSPPKYLTAAQNKIKKLRVANHFLPEFRDIINLETINIFTNWIGGGNVRALPCPMLKKMGITDCYVNMETLVSDLQSLLAITSTLRCEQSITLNLTFLYLSSSNLESSAVLTFPVLKSIKCLKSIVAFDKFIAPALYCISVSGEANLSNILCKVLEIYSGAKITGVNPNIPTISCNVFEQRKISAKMGGYKGKFVINKK